MMHCPICNKELHNNRTCGHTFDAKYHVLYLVSDFYTETCVLTYTPIRVLFKLDGLVFLTLERIEKLLLLK
jgi:hypothetical protein